MNELKPATKIQILAGMTLIPVAYLICIADRANKVMTARDLKELKKLTLDAIAKLRAKETRWV